MKTKCPTCGNELHCGGETHRLRWDTRMYIRSYVDTIPLAIGWVRFPYSFELRLFFAPNSLVYGVLARVQNWSRSWAALALDARENNQFRTRILDIDVFEPLLISTGR